MRTMIVGSTAHKIGTKERENFENACREIGRAIANAGDVLVVGSDRESTADLYVFEGFVSIDKHREIVVVRPEDGRTPFEDERLKHNIIYDRRKGPRASARVHQVLQADVVVAIGGGSSTLLVAQTAISLERPVLAIPCFEGSSKEIFADFEREYRGLANTANEMSIIKESWSEQHPDAIIRLLKILSRENPFVMFRIWPTLILFTISLLLLSAWLFLVQVPTISFLTNVFGILVISVWMGTALRYGLRQLTNPLSKMSLRLILNHASVGLILAFGLTLVYMMGGLGITGSWEFLLSSSTDDLLRVSVILSILGLTAGFLLEASANRLRSSLSQFIEE